MASTSSAPLRGTSLARKILFSAVAFLVVFALLEGGLALLGVRPAAVAADPYVGFTTYYPLFEPLPGDEATLHTAPGKLSLFNEQSFPRRKPDGTRRIFSVGGSSTYGRPFGDATSFSGWLRTYLGLLDHDEHWEVINAGGISYASYRVATLMEELIRYQPDVFVIYSGNNEFLEKRTYADIIAEPRPLTATRLLLQHSRLYTAGRWLAEAPRRSAEQRYEMTGEVEELLESSAGLDRYTRDETFEQRALEHYRFNLQRMVDLARSVGAQVVLVTVPVNEKDFSPFKSEHRDGLELAGLESYAARLQQAEAASDRGSWNEAEGAAREAVQLDPLYAEGHFALGRALFAQQRYDEAYRSFATAISEDVCPLRALEEIEDAIAETARRNDLPLVDYRALLRRWMQRERGHSILGDELFLDHVHPTIVAHGLLAEALVETLGEIGLLKLDTELWRSVRPVAGREVLAQVDAAAYARAYKNLAKVLLWAGKERAAGKYLRLAEQSLTGDWELAYSAGVVALDAGDGETAVRRLREAVHQQPEAARAWDQLGAAYASLGQFDAAVEAGERAVAIEPERATYWDNLAVTVRLAGDPRRAVELGQRAVRLDADFAEAFNNLGTAYFDLGELDAAQQAYERALELRPRFAEALANRGLVLGERGEVTAALASFEAALALDATLASAHLGRGRALLALGRPEPAAAALKRAAELGAGGEATTAALATAYLALGRFDEAREVVTRGLQLRPDAGELHHLNGRILAREGSYAAAARSFVRATELVPRAAQPWLDLVMLQLVRGQGSEGVEVCERALALHPESGGLHHLCAKALILAGGDPSAARTHLERALELQPASALVANDLGSLLERQGETERALELYRRASEIDPSLESARASAQRLSRSLSR